MELEKLVTVDTGKLTTTTLTIAEGIQVEHASLIALVRKYQSDLEEFGLVDFKSQSSGGRPTEFAYLNEQQATLILTYAKNSEIVRVFKKELVKAFYEFAKGSITPYADPMMMQLEMMKNLRMEQIELEARISTREVKHEQLELHLEGTRQAIVSTKYDVQKIKDNIRVENWQQNNLQTAMKAKVDQIHSLHPNSDVGELYNRGWKLFKQTFKIPRYNELPAMMYEDGMACIDRMSMWSFPKAKR